MRRTLPPVALALLLVLPLASAQAPDPAALVEQACALAGDAGDAIPLCPREEPAAPQQAQQAAAPEAAHEHATPEAAQEGAEGLAAEGAATVQDVAEEPASAPERVVAFLATALQLLKDLLGLGAQGLAAMGAGLADGAAYVAGLAGQAVAAADAGLRATGDAFAEAGGAMADAGAAVMGALDQAASALGSLFSGGAPTDARPAPRGAPASGVQAVDETMEGIIGLVPRA